MEKEEFRRMIHVATNEEHRQEVDKWLDYIEKEFEHMAEVTKWPIERIRSIYCMFGIGMGLGRE